MLDSHKGMWEPDDETLTLMRERLLGFMFPNAPQTDEEKEAFARAVQWQYEHDCNRLQASENVPEGVESFRIGDFQMAFEKGMLDSRLTRRNICPSVYGLLLRHGLLYRGVEGRLPYALD